MFDFNIHQFNPQPEPPPLTLRGTTADHAAYYKYELKNVQVSSYSMGGS